MNLTVSPTRSWQILALATFVAFGPLACGSSNGNGSPIAPDAGRVAGADAPPPPPILRPFDAAVKPDVPPDVPDLPPVGPSGLAGYWKFDEGSGTSTADLSGSLNHGSLLPGAMLIPGGFPAAKFPNPGAVAFDGVAGRIVLGVNRYPRAEGAKTLSFWVNYAAIPTAVSAMLSLTNGNESCGVQIGWRDSMLAVWGWGGGVFVNAPYPAPAWHNIIYTFDGTTHALVVDGAAPVTSTTMPQACAFTDAVLSGYPGGLENFVGTLDDLRIYNRVLSAAEISTLASGGDPEAPAPADGGGDRPPGDGRGGDAAGRDGSGDRER